METHIIEGLAIYDKDAAGLAHLYKAAKEMDLVIERSSQADDLVTSFFKYRIVVTHISDDHWKSLLSKSYPRTVRLRVSSTGRKHDPPPHLHEGTLVFSLARKVLRVSKDEWRNILEGLMSPEVCEELLQGTDSRGLMQYFAEGHKQSQELLLSLTLLCQAYLAIYAQAHGYEEPKPPHSEADVIQIMEMQNCPLLSKENVTAQQVRISAQSQLEQAQQASWWRDTLPISDLQVKIEREWQMLASDTNNDALLCSTAAVRQLIAVIERKDTPITIEIVAPAYMSVVRRFKAFENRGLGRTL